MKLSIGGIPIGADQPVRFIAEISNNHNGDLDRALRLVKMAKDIGADFVKFQCYTPDELLALRGDGAAPEPWASQGFTMRTLYEKAQTPLDWFPALFAEARHVGIVPFASVFGERSLAVLEHVDCQAYKVAKFERRARALQGKILSTGKPMIVSTGAPNAWQQPEADAVLYCPGGYPCETHDVKLPREFPVAGFIGLSAHTKHAKLPSVAVARGAKLIEYHLHLQNEPSELEANISLDERQFAAAILSAHRAEELF